VYHGETGVRILRELARSYLTIVKDLSRVMNRLKALYRSWAIPCAGRDVYYTRHRSQWLEKIPEAGTRRRAEQLYQQLDMLQHLRQQARRELLAESRKHAITAKLQQIPSLGPIRSALAVALIQTPHRFRSKRQLWTYSGLGLETRDSGEYHYVRGQVRRRKNNISCVDAHGAKVPFFAAHGMGTMGTMVQAGTHPVTPDHVPTTSPPSFDMATKSLPRYPVWLSTVWVALSIALLSDGHPATAFLPLFFWFVHRRWEVTDREESGVPSAGSVEPSGEAAAAAVDA
jgi:Transposase IS116/IS110/IS902 family